MKPHCGYCCAHVGWILFGWEHTGMNLKHVPGKPADCPGCYEVFAPCPFCDKGRSIELGVYGDNGYWHGNTPLPADVEETCRCFERPLGREASQQRLDEITAKLKAHLGDAKLNRRRQIAEQTTPVTAVLAEPSAVKLDTLMSSNGKPDEDDDVGTLL